MYGGIPITETVMGWPYKGLLLAWQSCEMKLIPRLDILRKLF